MHKNNTRNQFNNTLKQKFIDYKINSFKAIKRYYILLFIHFIIIFNFFFNIYLSRKRKRRPVLHNNLV